MNQLITITNPFEPTFSDVLDLIDEIQIEHLYNLSYKVSSNSTDPDLRKDILTAFTDISYTYLRFETDTASKDLYLFSELFNEAINQYYGFKGEKVSVTYYSLKSSDMFVKIVPYFNNSRIWDSEESIIRFKNSYQLSIDEVYISSDLLFDYSCKLLKEKNVFHETRKVNSLVIGKDKDYADRIDTVITKLKQENIFSLIEYKDDPILQIMIEVANVFEYNKIDDETLTFQQNFNEFQSSPKDWIVKSSLRVLNGMLPIYRFQTNNYLDNIDEFNDGLKARIKLAAILSCIKCEIGYSNIKVHHDLSVQVEIYSYLLIKQFTEYITDYIQQFDNWSSVLCPSLSQAITLRGIVKNNTRLAPFESYIVNVNDNEYLIVLTAKPETIKFSELLMSEVTGNFRGFKEQDDISLNLSEVIKVKEAKDCDNNVFYILKYFDQDLLLTYDLEKLESYKDKLSKIDNKWIKYYVKKYQRMSMLIAFL